MDRQKLSMSLDQRMTGGKACPQPGRYAFAVQRRVSNF
jgi:hypothetical protein